MKVKVIREFIDKHTGAYHPVGQELTISQERFDEIGTSGQFVEEIRTERKTKVKVKDNG